MRGPIKSQTLQLLRDRNVPVETVLDVGVQYCTAELLAAYPDHKHVLFEPVVEFHPAIHTNYRDTPHEIVAAAVSDFNGTAGIVTTRIGAGIDITHAWIARPQDAKEPKRPTDVVTLDRYISVHDCKPPFFLKIDVDGHEARVLSGAAKTLTLSSVVMIEAHYEVIGERISFLQSSGFRLVDMSEPCYYDGAFWQADLIFVRHDFYVARFADLLVNHDPKMYETFTG
jgi:FkbM family methyltransferase